MNDETKKVLVEMLKERTGVSLCDSGGEPTYDKNGTYLGSEHGYGRNYERFARSTLESFEAQPCSEVSFRHGEISVTHNVFHWLAHNLEYNARRDLEYQTFSELPEYENDHDLAIMEAYMEHLKAHVDEGPCSECSEDEEHDDDCCSCKCHESRSAPAGIYGEGEPLTINTYNNQDLLSQTIQYVYWTEGERGCREAYVLLQIHGGCDVRGGYTRPRVFNVTGDDGTEMFDNAKATIVCENDKCRDEYNRQTRWYTDDGYHWSDEAKDRIDLNVVEKIEASDAQYREASRRFKKLKDNEKRQGLLFELTREFEQARLANQAMALPHDDDQDSDDFKVWSLVVAMASGKPFLRYTDDGIGYCPRCKRGKLSSFYY